MEQKLFKWLACACACACVVSYSATVLAADESASDAEEKAEESASETKVAVSVPSSASAANAFHPLVRCVEVCGLVEVMKPGENAWSIIEEGHYYPIGTSFRTVAQEQTNPRVAIEFGPKSLVKIVGLGQFKTLPAEKATTRVVELCSGTVEISLPGSMTSGAFCVVAPQFSCADLAGDSRFEYSRESGDGDDAVVRVVTGTLLLKGRHYLIKRMEAADQIHIRSSADGLFTSLRGESGDFPVTLDQGTVAQKDFETGETKETVKTLDFVMSPKCAVKIFRARSAVGERMVVSMMTLDSSGIIKNRCAFTEGRANVNSGELVAVTAKPEKDAANEKDAKAEETETVEADDSDKSKKSDAENADEKDESSSDDKKSDDKKSDDKDSSEA